MTDQPGESDFEAEKARCVYELAELDRQIMIRNIAATTGVLPGMLQNAKTAEEMAQHAAAAMAWRADVGSASPSTASATYSLSVGQVSCNVLPHLSPAAQLEAWRQGRLEGIGAPAPPPCRNGEQHHNAAP
jgi:hypothetical protein